MLEKLTEQLAAKEALDRAQVREAVAALTDEQVPAPAKADFLSALAAKGETVEEMAAFAEELRSLSVQPPLSVELRAGEILDVCGTGGDKLHTFNISTTVAFVAAAAGIPVAKHGNRAITSACGSADVLQALGIKVDLPPKVAGEHLAAHGFAFFFAPHYHPAFKSIGPARKLCAERGQRTIFNFLGPLLNPARPTAQLIGVPRPELCEPMAKVLQILGVRRGMVVSGCVGAVDGQNCFLDELSTFGQTHIAEFYQDRGFHRSLLNATDYPVQPGGLEDLRGADATGNADILRALLQGRDRGPKRDAVLLNSAAALFVGGKARTLVDGWDLAANLIDSGAVQKKLDELTAASRKV